MRFFLLWFLFPFLAAVSFYGFFQLWKKQLSNSCCKFFAIISFALLQSSSINLYHFSDYSFKLLLLKFFRSTETKKRLVKFAVPKLQCLILLVIRVILLVHCIASSVPVSPQILFWSEILDCKKTQHPDVCCYFQVYTWLSRDSRIFALRQHKNTQRRFSIKTANVDPDDIVNKVDEPNSKEERRSCQIFLVCSELERTRHKVFNLSSVNNRNARFVNKKCNHFFKSFKYAAKVNLNFELVLKNTENGRFRYF